MGYCCATRATWADCAPGFRASSSATLYWSTLDTWSSGYRSQSTANEPLPSCSSASYSLPAARPVPTADGSATSRRPPPTSACTSSGWSDNQGSSSRWRLAHPCSAVAPTSSSTNWQYLTPSGYSASTACQTCSWSSTWSSCWHGRVPAMARRCSYWWTSASASRGLSAFACSAEAAAKTRRAPTGPPPHTPACSTASSQTSCSCPLADTRKWKPGICWHSSPPWYRRRSLWRRRWSAAHIASFRMHSLSFTDASLTPETYC